MNDHPKNERGKDDRAATSDMEAAKSHYAEMGGEADTAETGQDGGFEAEREAFLKLAKENEELKDRALRLAAEMENLRRRTARDVQDARAYAIANFARDMLTVCDDLRRAIDAVPAEARERGEAGW